MLESALGFRLTSLNNLLEFNIYISGVCSLCISPQTSSSVAVNLTSNRDTSDMWPSHSDTVSSGCQCVTNVTHSVLGQYTTHSVTTVLVTGNVTFLADQTVDMEAGCPPYMYIDVPQNQESYYLCPRYTPGRYYLHLDHTLIPGNHLSIIIHNPQHIKFISNIQIISGKSLLYLHLFISLYDVII